MTHHASEERLRPLDKVYNRTEPAGPEDGQEPPLTLIVSGKEMTEIWLRTDEREDAIASLKLFVDAVSLIKDDMAYWKWAIISLHSAVQSVMAFHLGFGNDLLVMSQEDAEAWLEAHESGGAYPEAKMDSFLNLYKKIKKNEILGFKFVPEGQQGSSIKRLNWFRNQFVHFMPKGWSIEMSGMPAIFMDCLNIIKNLSEGPISMRWEDENQSQVFAGLLKSAIEKTNAIYH